MFIGECSIRVYQSFSDMQPLHVKRKCGLTIDSIFSGYGEYTMLREIEPWMATECMISYNNNTLLVIR